MCYMTYLSTGFVDVGDGNGPVSVLILLDIIDIHNSKEYLFFDQHLLIQRCFRVRKSIFPSVQRFRGDVCRRELNH